MTSREMPEKGFSQRRKQIANSRKGKILRYLSLTFTVLLLGFLIILNWPSALGGRANWIAVSGISMLPNYQTGDMVVTWDTRNHGEGEVVLYSQNGTKNNLILHRIVGGDATKGWVLKGDNNTDIDTMVVPDKNILGVSLIRIPLAGYFLDVARQPPSILVFLGLGILIFLATKPGKTRRLERYPVEEPAMVAGVPGTLKDVHVEGARFQVEREEAFTVGNAVRVDAWLMASDGEKRQIRGILIVRYDINKDDNIHIIGGPVSWGSEEDKSIIQHHVTEYATVRK